RLDLVRPEGDRRAQGRDEEEGEGAVLGELALLVGMALEPVEQGLDHVDLAVLVLVELGPGDGHQAALEEFAETPRIVRLEVEHLAEPLDRHDAAAIEDLHRLAHLEREAAILADLFVAHPADRREAGPEIRLYEGRPLEAEADLDQVRRRV